MEAQAPLDLMDQLVQLVLLEVLVQQV